MLVGCAVVTQPDRGHLLASDRVGIGDASRLQHELDHGQLRKTNQVRGSVFGSSLLRTDVWLSRCILPIRTVLNEKVGNRKARFINGLI